MVTSWDWSYTEGLRRGRLGDKIERQPESTYNLGPIGHRAEPAFEMIYGVLTPLKAVVKTDGHIEQFPCRSWDRK